MFCACSTSIVPICSTSIVPNYHIVYYRTNSNKTRKKDTKDEKTKKNCKVRKGKGLMREIKAIKEPGAAKALNVVDSFFSDHPFFLRAYEGREAIAREAAIVPCFALPSMKSQG
jgi:hypothetical protein